jgi:hypothetical protein
VIIGQVFIGRSNSITSKPSGGRRLSRILTRVRGAARKESWGRTALKLAWTAGPVTYLALHGGYLIGYGDAPPPQVILYFGIYTVIAGVVAVVMRFLYNAVRGHEIEEGEESLHQVLQKLPDLVSAARNANLESYDDEGRITLAAKYVLENPDATPQEVSQAVFDLTDSMYLARTANAAEVYRRHGLTTRVHDLYASVAPELSEAVDGLAERSAAVARLVRNRFNGLAPTRRDGRARVEGFIERCFASAEQDDDSLMTMADVEEVFTLCYELLNNRCYPVLKLDYSGGHRFTAASVRLDTARRELRSAIHARNGRLRALAEHLNSYSEIARVAGAVPTLGSLNEVLESVRAVMDRLAEELPTQIREPQADRFTLERLSRLWSGAVALFQELYRENFNVRRKHLALYRASKEYTASKKRYHWQFPLQLLAPEEEGQGIRLRTKSYALTESQRLSFATALRRRLHSVSVGERFSRAYVDREDASRHYLGAAGFKHLARELVAVAEQYIPLQQSQVQYTIEGMNAPNLSAIHSHYSEDVKLRWGESLVKDLETKSNRAAERLAAALIVYHGVSLSHTALRYLEERFGVDPRKLPSESEYRDQEHTLPREGIQKQLLHIPPVPKEYLQLSETVQRRAGLARLGVLIEPVSALRRYAHRSEPSRPPADTAASGSVPAKGRVPTNSGGYQ